MRIVYILFTILLIFIIDANGIKAQNATIDLNIFADLSTIDFAAFAVEQNLENQPRMVQITINPPGMEVIVEGIFLWMKDQRAGFQEVGRFRTKPFKARTFFNDEIGEMNDIAIETSSYNSDLTKEILERGKPSGIFQLKFILYDVQGRQLDSDEEQLVFLNPLPPEIILPQNNDVITDIGSIVVSWNEVVGATSYKVLANYFKSGESEEQTLKSGTLLVDNKDVGKITNINLIDYLDRELLTDTVIVLAVKAVIHRPSGIDELMSNPVRVRIGYQKIENQSIGNQSTENQAIQNQSQGAKKVINPDLIRLADLLTGKLDENFIMKLKNGEISAEQIHFTDENGNILVFSDFVRILNYLEQNANAVINIQFSGR